MLCTGLALKASDAETVLSHLLMHLSQWALCATFGNEQFVSLKRLNNEQYNALRAQMEAIVHEKTNK